MKLKYKDLSQEEKKLICNGCGGKGGWIKPPNFLFKASCSHHDFLYFRGHNKKDRLKADYRFLKYMLVDVMSIENALKRILAFFTAFIYFFAVRLCGAKFFYYGENYRNRYDLEKIMKENTK
jgi:hypothetical protein